MKRVVKLDREYRCIAEKAIEKFFKAHPEFADEWMETFQWMAESGTEHLVDDTWADGSKNPDWIYSLWLERNENYTYIALVLRA